MPEYNLLCFACNTQSTQNTETLTPFSNEYGDWEGITCECGGMAKVVGRPVHFSSIDTITFHDGSKPVTMSKAHVKDIRSRAVTPDGTILRGSEGSKYNDSLRKK